MLTSREKAQIQRTITLLQKLLESSTELHQSRGPASKANGAGTRRSRKKAGAFRKQITAAYKKGAKVSDLSAMHGVTPAYIYQIIRKA